MPVKAALVAKMRSIDDAGRFRPFMSAAAAPCNLNPLLTIHTANSADLSGVAAAGLTGRPTMSINDLPMLSALRTKMQWHQERQRVLAENISNSDTPYFKPRDLVEPKFDRDGSSIGGSMGSLAMLRTSGSHIASAAGAPTFGGDGGKSGFQTRPAGNAVNLEDQMLKVSANQMDYAAATSLYSRSLGLLKTAIGKR
jgi:flagellar basal-body rod protein FlgB